MSDVVKYVVSVFVGNVINLFLYGALTVQLYLYYISFPQDPWLLKTVVYLIYVIETIFSIILTYDLGHSLFIGDPTWMISSIAIPVGGGIVAFLIQATYVYRLRILSQYKYVSWCIVACIVANLVVMIVMAVTTLARLGFALAVVWASISLAIDTTIAVIMLWILTKNELLSKQMKSKVTRLVHIIIGTGALTAAVNLVTLILSAMKSSAVYGPAIVLSKLYANSMMVFLNDRVMYGHDRDDHVVSEMVAGTLGSIRFATVAGPVDTAQELALDEGGDSASSTSGRTTIEDLSKKNSSPA